MESLTHSLLWLAGRPAVKTKQNYVKLNYLHLDLSNKNCVTCQTRALHYPKRRTTVSPRSKTPLTHATGLIGTIVLIPFWPLTSSLRNAARNAIHCFGCKRRNELGKTSLTVAKRVRQYTNLAGEPCSPCYDESCCTLHLADVNCWTKTFRVHGCRLLALLPLFLLRLLLLLLLVKNKGQRLVSWDHQRAVSGVGHRMMSDGKFHLWGATGIQKLNDQNRPKICGHSQHDFDNVVGMPLRHPATPATRLLTQ